MRILRNPDGSPALLTMTRHDCDHTFHTTFTFDVKVPDEVKRQARDQIELMVESLGLDPDSDDMQESITEAVEQGRAVDSYLHTWN